MTCWFKSHGDLLRERDAEGKAILVCSDCGAITRVLHGEPLIGPAHVQRPDRGVCTMKAKIVRPDNVREFKCSER